MILYIIYIYGCIIFICIYIYHDVVIYIGRERTREGTILYTCIICVYVYDVYKAISRLIRCSNFVPRLLHDICQALDGNEQDAMACHALPCYGMPWQATAWHAMACPAMA